MAYGTRTLGTAEYAGSGNRNIRSFDITFSAEATLPMAAKVIVIASMSPQVDGVFDMGDGYVSDPDGLTFVSITDLDVEGQGGSRTGILFDSVSTLTVDPRVDRETSFAASADLSMSAVVVSTDPLVDVAPLPVLRTVLNERTKVVGRARVPQLWPSQVYVFERHYLDEDSISEYLRKEIDPDSVVVLRGTLSLDVSTDAEAFVETADFLMGEVTLDTEMYGTVRLQPRVDMSGSLLLDVDVSAGSLHRKRALSGISDLNVSFDATLVLT